MNNGIQGAGLPPIVMANPVVELLKQMLAQAESGVLTSVAVIGVIANGGVGTAFAGGQRGDMYVGTGLLEDALLQSFKQPTGGRPPLIRVPG